MAKIYKCTVEQNSPSLLPRDAMQNNWWLEGPDSVSGVEWEKVKGAFAIFYNGWQTYRAAASVDSTGRFLARDTTLPTPAEPVYEAPMTFSRVTAQPLPLDCAAVATFAAPATPGVKVQSLRNRIYLGGLLATVNDGAGLISSDFRTAVATAYNNFAQELLDETDFEHVVYSPKLDQTFSVESAWMNNQWDTQRRRDRPPTAKSIFW